MNGIENITKRIADAAEKEAAAIIAEAEKEAAAIRDEYTKKSEEIKTSIMQRGAKIASEREARLSGSAELEARKITLAKKQELISRAFDAAAEKLRALSDDERADVIARLALAAADGGNGEIILSKADRDTIGSKVLAKCAKNGNVKLSEETREIGGGFVLRDGMAEVDCAFSSLVAELRDGMSREAADILFG
ncbi:MAG: hypothetical protein IJ299_02995 [Oscillospiraceae bacterium]|nr:hypothetical protein [Oscillospiraceae bacterium]